MNVTEDGVSSAGLLRARSTRNGLIPVARVSAETETRNEERGAAIDADGDIWLPMSDAMAADVLADFIVAAASGMCRLLDWNLSRRRRSLILSLAKRDWMIRISLGRCEPAGSPGQRIWLLSIERDGSVLARKQRFAYIGEALQAAVAYL